MDKLLDLLKYQDVYRFEVADMLIDAADEIADLMRECNIHERLGTFKHYPTMLKRIKALEKKLGVKVEQAT